MKEQKMTANGQTIIFRVKHMTIGDLEGALPDPRVPEDLVTTSLRSVSKGIEVKDEKGNFSVKDKDWWKKQDGAFLFPLAEKTSGYLNVGMEDAGKDPLSVTKSRKTMA